MNKKICCIFVLILCLTTIFSLVASAASEVPVLIQRGEKKEIEPGKFILYDNYAQFDDSPYDYNLDDMFPNGNVNNYVYTFVSSHSNDESVSIKEEILEITPSKPLRTTVVIKGYDEKTGATATCEFKLKFINSIEYMTGEVFGKVIWVFVLVFLLFIFVFFIPINGIITVTQLGGDILRSNTKSVKGCLYFSPKYFEYDGRNIKYHITGRFHGALFNTVIFVANQEVYINTKDSDGNTSYEKVRKIRISRNENTSIELYVKPPHNQEELQGIKIEFNALEKDN